MAVDVSLEVEGEGKAAVVEALALVEEQEGSPVGEGTKAVLDFCMAR